MSTPISEEWKVAPGFDVRTVDGDRFVASVFGAGSAQKLDRARLIAAAPALLAACNNLLDLLEGNSGAGANFWEQDSRYNQALAAVASAEKEAS